MSYWQEPIIIANKAFPRFIGGPLDGITDSPFRQLVRQFSTKELLYTEMRHVASLKRAPHALKFESFERPLNFQVAATTDEDIETACRLVEERQVDMVDLNIGCPAPIMVKSGGGSALMADLPRLEKLLKLFKKSLSIPFTVKIRAGFKCTNALEVAQLVQDCGADAIALHPRLQTQKFEGKLDYELTAKVKKAVTIPVIFSGGVVNFQTAKMVYELTGVDGFLISRGIWARPWKLFELEQHSLGNPWKVDRKIVNQVAIAHLRKLFELYGQRGMFMFRKNISLYLKGMGCSPEFRQQLVAINSAEEILDLLTHLTIV